MKCLYKEETETPRDYCHKFEQEIQMRDCYICEHRCSTVDAIERKAVK
jgi:hypothetical protein